MKIYNVVFKWLQNVQELVITDVPKHRIKIRVFTFATSAVTSVFVFHLVRMVTKMSVPVTETGKLRKEDPNALE